MKKNRKVFLVIALLLLVGLTGGYVASTYAKYTSSLDTNTAKATVAKWAFASDNEEVELKVKFTEEYDPTTLVKGKIAPGTSGSFNIALVNANTETGVDFTVSIKDVSNVPANLKFYTDEEFTNEITPGSVKITGQLAAKDSTGLTIPIYWKWAYYTSNSADEVDTSLGENPTELAITLSITGVQTPPSDEPITSHID